MTDLGPNESYLIFGGLTGVRGVRWSWKPNKKVNILRANLRTYRVFPFLRERPKEERQDIQCIVFVN